MTMRAPLVLLAACAQMLQAAPPAPLDRWKALAGEWLAAEDGPMAKKGDLVARYAVTAGGTAVVETVFPGTPHEMVTVYHADGPDVVLQHFCMEGNQPRMRAKEPAARRVQFAFDGGTNIDPARSRHMHRAWMEFTSNDALRTEWTEIADGTPVLVVESSLVRRNH
jgi:hypothetical protein